MSEESFKKHRKDKIRKVAFEYLIAKQNNMQTKNVAYDTYLGIAPYLQEDSLGYSVKEKQNLFQSRMNDLDEKANRTWKYDNLICKCCKNPGQIETQQHILTCQSLVNRNMMISYLPTYSHLYSCDIEE